MSRRLAVLLAVATFVVLALSLGAAQAATTPPSIVNLNQVIPLTVAFAVPLDDGTTVTATAPITVHVALQVTVDGANIVAATTPTTATATATATTDDLGLAYTVDADPGIEITEWTSYENKNGDISVIGALINADPDRRVSVVNLVLKFYDDAGKLIDTATPDAAGGHWVDPGESLPFDFDLYGIAPADVASYTVTATGGDWTPIQ